jgi:SAM domain (Sterile alpha motif)
VKVTGYEIVDFGPGSDREVRVELTIDNATLQRVHGVKHEIHVLDCNGFPLASTAGWKRCELGTGEATTVSTTSLRSPVLDPDVQLATMTARATATLYSCERVDLGEVRVPSRRSECVPTSREHSLDTLESPLRATVFRCNDDGGARVACRLLLRNKSDRELRVDFEFKLIGAPGETLTDDCQTHRVPAMSTDCVQGETSPKRTDDFLKRIEESDLKGAKVRLALLVYTPIATTACAGTAQSVRTEEPKAKGDNDWVEIASWGDGEEDEVSEEDADDLVPIGAPEGDQADLEEVEPADSDVRDDDGVADRQHGLDSEVMRILETAKAMEYAQGFLKNEITAEVLASLSDADLASIGVAALGARKRILAAIAAAPAVASAPELPSPRSPSAPPDTGSTSAASSAVPGTLLPNQARPTTDWKLVTDAHAVELQAHPNVQLRPYASDARLLGALAYAPQLGSNSHVLLLCDDTLFRSGKEGVIVSDQGVHWRNEHENPHFTPWTALPVARADGKRVEIKPGGLANSFIGGEGCATGIARFINSACGAFLASMPMQAHSKHGAVKKLVAPLAQCEGNDVFLVRSVDGLAQIAFSHSEGRLMLSVVQPAEGTPARLRLAAFSAQVGGFQERILSGGSRCLVRHYDAADADAATHHAFHCIRVLLACDNDPQVLVQRG